MEDNVIAEQKAEYKPRNFRIISLRTAKRMLHVEDALDLARIRVELWAYEKGDGATAHADAYLDVDTARVLAAFLASGSLPEPVEDLGGGMVAGRLTARIFRAEEAEGTQNPIRITVTNGPGTRQPSGLISLTKGAQVERVQLLLSRMDARRIGLALAEHLQAWATHTYASRLAAGTWRPESPSDMDVFEGRSEAPAGPSRESEAEPDRPEPAGDGSPGVVVRRAPEPASRAVIPSESADAEPAAAELGEDDRSLRYANGAAVGDNEAEIQAFRAYVAAEQTVPVSIDDLRSWLRRTSKARRS